ncbi:rRNA methyltransferase 3A, mitochondrial [Hoplias malabaricus]|uniref:rRNA methyltransferase 3A, mitochondrial n=1 Tax=Hoplias malabaricus TaxID=27720 RepID=UPI003462FDBA
MAALFGSASCGLALFKGQGSYLRSTIRVVVDARRFIRGMRRKPVAVLHPDGEREARVKSKTKLGENKPTLRNTARTEGGVGLNTGEKAGMRDFGQECKPAMESSSWSSVREKLGGLRFDRVQPGDKRLAKVVSIARSRVFREQQGKVLLEGKRLIYDALAAGAVPQMLFFSRLERLCELPLDKLHQASLLKVKFEDIKIWSDVVAPQGVIAIFSKPDPCRLSFPKDLRLQTVPLFLICDNIRDPGNLGTILRCAAAAGCDRVLLNKGCVDAWEPKVLRAAMGAHFRLPIFPGLDWDDISEHLPKPVTVHVAVNTNKFMIKHNTNTLSPVAQKPRDEGLVSNRDSSNNTQLEEYVESDSDDDDSDKEPSLLYMEQKVYHEDWAQRSTALVISGETHGLSSEALELAQETNGQELFVPMAPGVECINSAMSASILLFEGRRQLMKLAQKDRRRVRSVIHR